MLNNRLVLAVLAVGLATLAATTAAAKPCKTYTGTFTAVAPADCASPVGICTHGTLVGGFPSTYDFVADTLVPTDTPGEFTYTGHSLITARKGTLTGSDSGHLTMQPDGTATFVTTVKIVGGTGKYEDVTGQFVAPGVLTLATGGTVGSYTAQICKHEDDDADAQESQ
jgi:hypothetical protein